MSTRINKSDDGFVMATSNNLPAVDFEMFMDFLANSIKSRLETQGWKMTKSCRESYGDNAIGYVQVKRNLKVVNVVAKITPEHKLHDTPYSVEAQVDESKMCLNFVACHGCVASQGIVFTESEQYFRVLYPMSSPIVLHWNIFPAKDVTIVVNFRSM